MSSETSPAELVDTNEGGECAQELIFVLQRGDSVPAKDIEDLVKALHDRGFIEGDCRVKKAA